MASSCSSHDHGHGHGHGHEHNKEHDDPEEQHEHKPLTSASAAGAVVDISRHSMCRHSSAHMEDDVELSEDELERRNNMKRLKCAAVLCVSFFFIEVIGGYLAGSLAVLSDAAHLFSDLASFLVAIFANYLASLPSTTQHTYGLKRSESLAALFSMISLAMVCVWLGYEALRRLYVILFMPELAADIYNVDGRLMSGIASIGVLVNLALAWVLGGDHGHMPGGGHCHSHDHDHGCEGEDDDDHDDHGHSHHDNHDEEKDGCGHSHGHSHDHHDDAHNDEKTGLLDPKNQLLQQQQSSIGYSNHSSSFTPEHVNEVLPPFLEETKKKKKKRRNVNLQAAYLHVLGDLAQSVAVLIAGLVIWFKPSWFIVDPIATLGFCILVFYSTLGVVRASIAVLLEEVPPQISWKDIHGELSHIPNISRVHDLHIWCISDGVPCLSMHAFCDDGNCQLALTQINQVCRKYGIEHVTAQVQPTTTNGATSTSTTTTLATDPCITCEGASHN